MFTYRLMNIEYCDCFMGEIQITESEYQAYPQQMPQAAVDRICEAFELESCNPVLIRLTQVK